MQAAVAAVVLLLRDQAVLAVAEMARLHLVKKAAMEPLILAPVEVVATLLEPAVMAAPASSS
jgi:hypothetical protein